MSVESRSQAASKPKAGQRKSIFGPAPIIQGEDIKLYEDLLEEVRDYVNPKDVIEEIFVHDVVDLTWEILRWRTAKASLISRDIGEQDPPGPDEYGVINAITCEIENIERIDRLEAIAEDRRNAALHEIERHRLVFAQALQNKIRQIEDADFKPVEPMAIEQKGDDTEDAA